MAAYNILEAATLNGRTVYVMKVRASDIELVNFGYNASTALKTLSGAEILGMNGCWFGQNPETHATELCNIVYQSGKPLGSLPSNEDATENKVGKSVIYWTGSALKGASGISTVTDMTIPTARGSWVQGGCGLYFGSSNWDYLMENSMPNTEEDTGWIYLSQAHYRTAMVAHPSTGDVYLFAWTKNEINLGELRQDIFTYLGISEYTSYDYFGLMLDGGRSTQIRGLNTSGRPVFQCTLLTRTVPQVIKVRT